MSLFTRVALCAVLASATFACTGGNSPSGDAQKSPAQIEKEAEAMDASRIKEVVKAYEEAIADLTARSTKMIEEIDPAKLLTEAGKKAKEKGQELVTEADRLRKNMEIYLAELAKK